MPLSDSDFSSRCYCYGTTRLPRCYSAFTYFCAPHLSDQAANSRTLAERDTLCGILRFHVSPKILQQSIFPGTMRLGFCTIEACFLQHNGFDLSDETDQMGVWPTFSRMSYGSGREDERGEVTLVWRSLSQNTSETN